MSFCSLLCFVFSLSLCADKKKQKITGDPLLLPSEEDVKEAESTVKRLRKQLSSYLEEVSVLLKQTSRNT